MRSKRLGGAFVVAAALMVGAVVAPAAGGQPGTGGGLRTETYTCTGIGTVTVKATGGNVAFDVNGTVFHAVSITSPFGTKTFGQMKGLGPRITCTGVGFPVTVVAAPVPKP